MRGGVRTVLAQGNGGKWVGRKARWRSASVAARRSADGVVAMERKEMGGERGSVEISERRCADECGRCCCKGMDRMSGVKSPVDMSERSCAEGCGRCWRKGMEGNGWGEMLGGDKRA